jgi:probable F420-dependent oxidoreductase
LKFVVLLPNCMHVSAVTQPWEHSLTGADIALVAQEADALGFWGVALPEHYLTPTDHLDLSGDHYFDASTAQGFIAGSTTNVRVGSLVTILPLHHPVVMAKAVATLDWLSGGRAFFTFGVGWMKEEFDALHVPFERRGYLADEYLAAIHELLHKDRPSFHGPTIDFADVAFGPKPIQRPHPPLWLGGDADAVIRRAARFADGWAPWLTTPDKLPDKLELLRSQPEWDDRPFDVFYSLAALNVGVGHTIRNGSDARVEHDRQATIDSCGMLADNGVTHTWVTPPPLEGLEAYLDHLQWVAEEIIPACS